MSGVTRPVTRPLTRAITHPLNDPLGVNTPSFVAPLITSTTPTRGTGSASFTRATIATVLGYKAADNAGTGPCVVAVASGEARFTGARRLAQDSWSATYADGSPIPSSILLGYLTEFPSTNLLLQSENFGTTWAAVGTPTRTAAAATCGDLVLDLIGDDDAAVLEGYTQGVTFTADTKKGISIFVKQDTSVSSMVRLRDTTGAADRLLAAITWSAGVPVVTMTTGTLLGVDTLANSVFRIRMQSTTVTAASAHSVQIYPASTAALAVASTGRIYAGGVMAEDAANSSNNAICTSYIPTTTATVTRDKDALTYALANIPQGAGTCYAEVTVRLGVNNPRIVGFDVAPLMLAPMEPRVYDGTTSATAGLANVVDGVTSKLASYWSGAVMQIFKDNTAGTAQVFDGAMNASAFGVALAGSVSDLYYGHVRNVKLWSRSLGAPTVQGLTV